MTTPSGFVKLEIENEGRMIDISSYVVYIQTEQRRDDWIAFIAGHSERWEAGKTEDEAIDKLKNRL
jgi:hypothetical protein